MPIYEFECRDCGKTSEILVSASRKPVCPHCGGEKLEKQFSAFATGGGHGGGSQDSCASPGGGGHRCCGGCCHH